MKLLVFGSTGQVACELHRLAPEATFLSRAEADLSDPPSCAAAIRASGANIVINAAAYTAVDKAESEPEVARLVNATSPGRLAEAALEVGARLIHISTDYVFDGEQFQPYAEDDPTSPINVYGRSKLEGEVAIAAGASPLTSSAASSSLSARSTAV